MSTLTSAQNKKPMESLTIDEWVKQLGGIPEKDFTIPHVLEFTQQKAIQPETLAPYIFYANSHYTRNLIHKCELFEILAICWNVGQVSRIHNHRGQNCWMVTPIGCACRISAWKIKTPRTAAAN
jgi:cysteine dioxygenase